MTCSDDGSMAIFTTTVVYSSISGDITASDMINSLKSWAAINGVGASVEFGANTATVRQVCSPTCESLSPSVGSNSGAFIGGLIGGLYWLLFWWLLFGNQ